MLLPRYSLRWILVLLSLSSVFFLVLAVAVRGHAWAIGVSVGIASLFLAFLLYALLFLMAWAFTPVRRELAALANRATSELTPENVGLSEQAMKEEKSDSAEESAANTANQNQPSSRGPDG